MRRLVALAAVLFLIAAPASATEAFLGINEPGPYAVGDVITLTVEPGKLKGYEYPVVLEWCGFRDDGQGGTVKNWVYFRRWDTKGYDYPRSTGPEPVTLTTAGTCTFELWAYNGLHPAVEHVIIIGPTFTVT